MYRKQTEQVSDLSVNTDVIELQRDDVVVIYRHNKHSATIYDLKQFATIYDYHNTL